MFVRHPVLSLCTMLYLAVVGVLTLSPGGESGSDGPLWRLALLLERSSATEWLTFDRLELAANVLMFVPIGLFFVLLLGRRRWWLAVLAGVALTCGIEFAQQFVPSRVSDPRDLISNSLGAFAGVVAALVLTAPAARRQRRTRLAKAA